MKCVNPEGWSENIRPAQASNANEVFTYIRQYSSMVVLFYELVSSHSYMTVDFPNHDDPSSTGEQHNTNEVIRYASLIVLRAFFPRTYLAADFPNHDNALGLGVVGEPLQAVDEVGAVKRIATDTHAGALTHAC